MTWTDSPPNVRRLLFGADKAVHSGMERQFLKHEGAGKTLPGARLALNVHWPDGARVPMTAPIAGNRASTELVLERRKAKFSLFVRNNGFDGTPAEASVPHL